MAAPPTPAVTGPIASDTPGSAGRNYTFFATDIELAKFGYVEEEFFFDGMASTYNTTTTPATVTSSGHPYRSRLVVIRPRNPAKFSGVALVEWQNVTNGYDVDAQWQHQHDYIMRSGHAWIGVSAQDAGISRTPNGLKVWSPTRYASLDITDKGTVTSDGLSYDVFGQAAEAVRNVPGVLGGLRVQQVIALGLSQSASKLYTYFNAVHALDPTAYDGLLATQNGGTLRTDLTVPAMKVYSELEAASTPGQPDTPMIHTWSVAGAAHIDYYSGANRAAFLLRDLGLQFADAACVDGPTRSRIPQRHVINAATEALIRQIRTGEVPRAGIPFQYTGSPAKIARDANGNAMGGIRVANAEVPVGRDDGTVCGLFGVHIPFSDELLATLYPTHDAYVAAIRAAADASVAAGFVLPEDAQQTKDEAARSIYGAGLKCDALCADSSQFPLNPTVSLLRRQTASYSMRGESLLLNLLDEATAFVAKGNTFDAGSKGRQASYGLAVGRLQKYADRLAQLQAAGLMAAETASLYGSQAQTLMQKLATP